MSIVSVCEIARTTPSILFNKSNILRRFCYVGGPKYGPGICINGTYLSKRGYGSSHQSVYDCRKYGHNFPDNEVMPSFEPLPNIPTGVFRTTAGERRIGPGAAKCGFYQQIEYFSYHHMTFYDMHMALQPCRLPPPNTKRKP